MIKYDPPINDGYPLLMGVHMLKNRGVTIKNQGGDVSSSWSDDFAWKQQRWKSNKTEIYQSKQHDFKTQIALISTRTDISWVSTNKERDLTNTESDLVDKIWPLQI